LIFGFIKNKDKVNQKVVDRFQQPAHRDCHCCHQQQKERQRGKRQRQKKEKLKNCELVAYMIEHIKQELL